MEAKVEAEVDLFSLLHLRGRSVGWSVVNWSVCWWYVGLMVGRWSVGQLVGLDQTVGWYVGRWLVGLWLVGRRGKQRWTRMR